MKGKKAKKTISFRLDPHIIDKLGQAAKEDKITMNALVDQIFDNYVHWERKAAKIGWILIKNDILRLFMENLNEKTLAKLAKSAAKMVMRDTLLSISTKVDLESWLFVTKNRSLKSNFVYREVRDDNQTRIVITHGMGPRWSLFHKIYYKEMLNDLGVKSTVEDTPNTLVIKIKDGANSPRPSPSSQLSFLNIL